MNSTIIQIYTDGACSGNPGPGGFGVVMKYKDQRKELAQGYKLTTNNRMELTACVEAFPVHAAKCGAWSRAAGVILALIAKTRKQVRRETRGTLRTLMKWNYMRGLRSRPV